MGKPLPESRLAVLPATSHTAVITQVDLQTGFIEPFLKGETQPCYQRGYCRDLGATPTLPTAVTEPKHV